MCHRSSCEAFASCTKYTRGKKTGSVRSDTYLGRKKREGVNDRIVRVGMSVGALQMKEIERIDTSHLHTDWKLPAAYVLPNRGRFDHGEIHAIERNRRHLAFIGERGVIEATLCIPVTKSTGLWGW